MCPAGEVDSPDVQLRRLDFGRRSFRHSKWHPASLGPELFGRTSQDTLGMCKLVCSQSLFANKCGDSPCPNLCLSGLALRNMQRRQRCTCCCFPESRSLCSLLLQCRARGLLIVPSPGSTQMRSGWHIVSSSKGGGDEHFCLGARLPEILE